MNTVPEYANLAFDAISDIQFKDIFDLGEIQHLQDLFADTHLVASLITDADGKPITKPSNFCRLCNNIIRKTEKGRANCYQSDAAIGKQNSYGSIVQPCLSGGLWDAGASINVGGKHIANWLVGQIRNEKVDEQRMIQYADEIGANREDFMTALNEVPVMPVEQFEKVSKLLFVFAKELSERAYSNLQLKMQVAEKSKANKLLQESEERFHTLFNKAPLGYQALNFDGCFIEVNQQWLDTLGYTREEVIGKWFGDYLSPSYQDGFRERFPIFKAQGRIHSEFEMVHKNGNILFIAFEGTIGYDLNGEFRQTHCILQDITECKQAEDKHRHVARLYAVLSQINQAIVRIREQDELFRTICQVAIEFGRFRMAWVGLTDEANDRIKPVTHAGHEDGYLRQIHITTGDSPTGKGPIGSAIRAGQVVTCYDIATEPHMLPWREEALKRGYKSSAAVPFRCKKKLVGTLNLYSTETGFFTVDEQKLLQEIGEDISFALDAMISETERKKAEVSLKESEERYRGFILQVSEGVYRFESDQPMDLSLPLEEQVDFIYDHMLIAECNNAFIRMYGFGDQKDIIGKGHLDFHGGRYNQVNRDLLRKFIAGGYSIQNGITEETNVAGQPIYISNNSLGIIEDNHLIRMWGTQIDITEKMRSDRVQNVLYAISNAALSSNDLPELIEIISRELGKLLDSTNFYIAFYNEMTDMLSTLYIKDERDQINSWPAEKSATGYVIKHQRSLLVSDTDVIKMCEAGEIEIVGTPSKIWLGVPLSVNKKVIGAIVVQSYDNPDAFTEKDKLMLEFVSHQISIAIERKKADQELKDALAKAQESDLLKSAFLANMSHEIRTPMNGILGFAGLLKEPNLTGEEQQTYIRIIEKSGVRMLNIINDIICISKVESGQMEVSISETNINMQIEYIYTFFKPEVEGKGMNIICKNGLPSKEAIVKTDKEKIYAILTNLVKNAIKYSDKGTIEFGYELAGAVGEPVEPELQFFVKDTGIGIPIDRQKAVFDRFVQADISDKRAFQGAGLGLSISKAFVEMLGGKIWVESEVGKGSIFYFTIPYDNGLEEKPVIKNAILNESTEIQINPEISGLKILIVEDDEGSAKLIALTIKVLGKDILKVKTGVEAIEACHNHPDIDLVLMDIKLPIMDGYEATRQIRQFNKEVVIVAQTAFALIGDREKAIEAGCDDYIAKPIKKAELMVLLQKYFKK